MLWSISRTSRAFSVFSGAPHFAVSILAEDQIPISQRFASKEQDKFASIDWYAGKNGAPLMTGAAGRLECTTEAVHEGGDLLIIGRVTHFEREERKALIFSQSRYSIGLDHPVLRSDTGSAAVGVASGETSLGSSVFKAHLKSSRSFDAGRNALGLSIGQARILFVLSEHKSLPLDELVGLANLPSQTIEDALADLQSKGAAQRNVDGTASLTDKGRGLRSSAVRQKSEAREADVSPASPSLLHRFRSELATPGAIMDLCAGLIGDDAPIAGPFGEKRLVYADYVASGRGLMQVGRFILERVLPYYANSHAEASHCGGFMTRLRREARATIASCCNAGPEHAVIFAGSGATAGVNRLVNLLGAHKSLVSGKSVRVIVGPYEHHSNILPWRESGAEVVEIEEGPEGGPDLDHLDAALAEDDSPLTICSFSAASNVTGITSDVAVITRRVKAAGARMIWDYAAAGPYLPIDMSPAADCQIDAIVVSPHKFVGGPGGSGVLIVRRDAVTATTPTWPGGGTVTFVSPWAHDYSAGIEAREEAGTPNVIGDIRAVLAFVVKEAIEAGYMSKRNE